ncbi:MAG: cysteine hydrolase [Oscillospiraceae bacterium]|nr:cysteine hydrolase [Oscillospiraceae bacterium]
MKQALLIIDMQNGFLNPASPLWIRDAQKTVPACARVIQACRQNGIPVIFVNRAYRPDGSDVELTRYDVWAAGGKPLLPGSTGPLSVENPPEFGRTDTDYEIIKPRYSAFFQTSLDLLLRRLGIDTLLLTGTTTPNCIRTTCYDAISLDYRVTVVSDCCSSNTEAIQQANLLDMRNIGAEIILSDGLLRTFSSTAPPPGAA